MMRRRWLSHAVALLCIVYLIALLVFHQHLDPFTSNNHTPEATADQSSALRFWGGNFSNPQLQAPRTLKLQLRQLEAGMSQLEQEISHVKSRLTQDLKDPSRTIPPRRTLQPPELNSQDMLFPQLRQPRFEVRSRQNDDVRNREPQPQGGKMPYVHPQEGRTANYRPSQDGGNPINYDSQPQGGQISYLHPQEGRTANYRPSQDGGNPINYDSQPQGGQVSYVDPQEDKTTQHRDSRDGDGPVYYHPQNGGQGISEQLHSQDGGVSSFDQSQVGDISSDHRSQDSVDSNHPESHNERDSADRHRTKDIEIINRLHQQNQQSQNNGNQQNVEVRNFMSQGQDFLSGQVYYGPDGQAQRNRLRRQQERFYRQPFNNRMPPVPPEGLLLPSDPVLDVQGLNEDASLEEDFTNSSLVKIGEGVAVYAAYHDDREPTKPTVRLIIILSAPKPKRGILCHFLTNGPSFTVAAEQYELCENHKKKYLGFIYSCPAPGGVPRARYRLFLSPVDQPEARVPMPVIDVSPPEIRDGTVSEESHQYRYNLSVCVSPLFGSVMAKRLVEFLELTHMLGFQHVFFYDFQLSSVIQRVLDYYQKKGYVSVLPWKLPASMGSARIWYHGQLVTNNDCLFRTMPLSAYTAFHDIDEFVVPHHPTIRTLGELLPRALPNDTCGYSFQSAFYDPGISGDFADDLMTVALTARPAMLSKIRTKVLVAPRRVFEVGIHHISKQFREHWAPRRYDSSRAILHHYRHCIHDYGMRCENWVKDTIIRDRYLPELKTRMQDVIRTLRL